MGNDRLITTKDNPWNPFENWDEWFTWDHAHGYDTWNYVARIAKVNENMSEKTYHEEISKAFAEILYYDLTGNYIVIEKNDLKED